MKKIIIIFIIFLFFSNISFGQAIDKPYSNPILIYGSSFGNFFKTLYKTGDFNTMMKFTSSKSIKEYGYETILNYYKENDFGYDMKLRSRTYSNGVYTLNYISDIVGTKRVTRMDVVIENDSCKLVIDNILFNLGICKSSIPF